MAQSVLQDRTSRERIDRVTLARSQPFTENDPEFLAIAILIRFSMILWMKSNGALLSSDLPIKSNITPARDLASCFSLHSTAFSRS